MKKKPAKKTKILKKKQPVKPQTLTKAKPMATENVSENVDLMQVSERESLLHQWKCYMDPTKGDLGKAALIKRQLEKSKPITPPTVE